MEHTAPPFFRRGPGLFARLGFFALLSVILLYGDARFHYMEGMRRVVAVVIYPLHLLADLPGAAAARLSSVPRGGPIRDLPGRYPVQGNRADGDWADRRRGVDGSA